MLCSASWFIKAYNYYEMSLAKQNSAYHTKLPEDTKAEYFTTEGLYNGDYQAPTMKLAGAKEFFGEYQGTKSDDEFLAEVNNLDNGYYKTEFASGTYRDFGGNKTTQIQTATHQGVAAGTHYYKITDLKTGQVICLKHEFTIKPATVGASLAAQSGPWYENDKVKYSVTILREDVDGNENVTFNYTDNDHSAKFEDGKENSATHTVTGVKIAMSKFKTAIGNAFTDTSIRNLFFNNFDIDNSGNATASYTVNALAYSYLSTDTGNKLYYGTLETAIKSTGTPTSGTATVVAMPSDKHVINGDCTVNAGVTLLIPYEGETCFTNTWMVTSSDSKQVDNTSVFANQNTFGNTDYRKNLVTLKARLTNKGTISIGAQATGGHGGAHHNSVVCRYYSEIALASGATIDSYGTINCYGFITNSDNTGALNLKNGSQTTVLFSIVEHRGGSAFTGMLSDGWKDAPFDRYFIQSIAAQSTIDHGAKLIGKCNMYMNNKDNISDVTLIGPDGGDATYFFQSQSGTTIKFKYDPGDQKNYVTISGNASLNSFDVTISGQAINTSSFVLPLSDYWHVELTGAGSVINIPSQNIKLLPGAYLKVDSGVKLVAQSIAVYSASNVVDNDADPPGDTKPDGFSYVVNKDAKLIVNGSLEAQNLGGVISTESANASVVTQGTSIQCYEMTAHNKGTMGLTGSCYYVGINLNATGNIKNSANAATQQGFLANKTYSSASGNFWYQSVINVSYVANGTTTSKQATITSPGYLLTGNCGFTPTNPPTHYQFEGWYIDQSLTASAIGQTVYVDSTLYAKWTPQQYPAIFVAIDPDGNANTSLPMPGGATFTVETANVLSLVTNPTDPNGTYNFEGWYTDQACTNKVSEITGQALIDLENGYTLYGKWSKETVYTINYNTGTPGDKNGVANTSETFKEGDTIPALRTVIDFTNDLTKSHVFLGWKLNGEGEYITDLSSMMSANAGTPEFTLVAEWREKAYCVKINDGNNGHESSKITFSPDGGAGYKSGIIYFDDLNILFGTSEGNYGYSARLYDMDPTVNRYFVGWKLDANMDGQGDGAIVSIDNFNSYEKGIWLTPTWGNKLTISVTHAQDSGDSGSDINANYSLYIAKDQQGTGEIRVGNKEYSNEPLDAAYITPGYYYKFTITSQYNNSATNMPTSYTKATADVKASIKSYDKTCIAAGTLITLADGTVKKVEDLLETDILLVFDHETGKFVEAPILFIERDGWAEYNVINLRFSDGRVTRIIYEHALFDITLNKYVYITEENFAELIGHEFAVMDGDGMAAVTLTEAFVTTEYTGCFSLVTAYHLNYFIDGLFSIPGGIDGLFNIFEYGDGLKYDEEKMQADIEKYGLYTYEDFAEYLPEEIYNAFPAPYFKVAVGKGYITFEEIIGYIETYLVRNGLI